MSCVELMDFAIELALSNIDKGGGPFGAIVVRDSEIISCGTNSVTIDNDPTAHAEVNAIRNAAKKLGKFDLSDCVLYTTCEPCPMCFGAIYWARIKKVYYSLNRDQAANSGFDDRFIYSEVSISPGSRTVHFEKMDLPKAKNIFEKWNGKTDRICY